MSSHLSADLSVDALAERANLSPRQLHRKFATAFGVTPAHVVNRLRLDAARDRLLDRRLSIKQIAKAVDYESADVFRRSFGVPLHATGRLPAILFVRGLSCDAVELPPTGGGGLQSMIRRILRESGALVRHTEHRSRE